MIYVAKIIGVHGIKGAVKIYSYTTPCEAIFQFACLYDNNNVIKIHQLQQSKSKKNVIIANIKNVTNRNDAEKLIGTKLFVQYTQLPQISDQQNEFYHVDLIGIKVFNQNQEEIGTIDAVYNFGAGDIIEIKTINGNKIMAPFNTQHFPIMDITSKYAIFVPMEIV